MDKKRPDGLDCRSLSRAPGARLGAAPARRHGRSARRASRPRPASGCPRQQLLSALADACPTWSEAGNRLLLTSRPYGLSAEQAARTTLGSRRCSRCRASCRRCWRIAGSPCCRATPEAGAETAADLFANIDSQPWLVELAANPLLLTAMCIVFDEGKRLPQDKHELYERVVATVLYSRYQDPADIDRVEAGAGRHRVRHAHRRRDWPTAEPRRRPRRPSTKSSGGCRTTRSARSTPSGRRPACSTRARRCCRTAASSSSTGRRPCRLRAPVVPGVLRGAAELHRGRGTAGRGVPASARRRPSGATRCRSCSGGWSARFRSRRRRSTCWKRGSTAASATRHRPAAGARRRRAGAHGQGDHAAGREPAAFAAGAARGHDRALHQSRTAPTWAQPSVALAIRGFGRIGGGCRTRTARVHQGRGGSLHDGERSREGSARRMTTSSRNTSSSCPSTTSPAIRSRSRSFARSSRTRSSRLGDPDCLRGVANHPVRRVSFHEALAYCRWLTERLQAMDVHAGAARANGWRMDG